MNRSVKTFLALTSIILLAGCSNGKKDPYVYPDTTTDFEIDYSFNSGLQDNLNLMYLVDGEEMTSSEISQFLSFISENDLYANKLEYSYQEEKNLYADNDIDKLGGSYFYSERKEVNRDNETDSLSGTIKYTDKKWTNDANNYSEAITSGTYSLYPEPDKDTGVEKIVVDNEAYCSETRVGYSEKNWTKQMNLTQSSEIGKQLKGTIDDIEEYNKTLANEYKFNPKVISRKNDNSLQVELTAESIRPNPNAAGEMQRISYIVSIKIAGGMIVNTLYQYSQIDLADTKEFVVESVKEERTLSKI